MRKLGSNKWRQCRNRVQHLKYVIDIVTITFRATVPIKKMWKEIFSHFEPCAPPVTPGLFLSLFPIARPRRRFERCRQRSEPEILLRLPEI